MNRSTKCKTCKKYLGESFRDFPEGIVDDGINYYCNDDCYKKKDPLDEIFVEKVEINLTTAKMRIKQKDSEIKKLKSKHQKIKFKLERRVEDLEENLEASGKAVSYWVDRFMKLKTEYDAVHAVRETGVKNG